MNRSVAYHRTYQHSINGLQVIEGGGNAGLLLIKLAALVVG